MRVRRLLGFIRARDSRAKGLIQPSRDLSEIAYVVICRYRRDGPGEAAQDVREQRIVDV